MAFGQHSKTASPFHTLLDMCTHGLIFLHCASTSTVFFRAPPPPFFYIHPFLPLYQLFICWRHQLDSYSFRNDDSQVLHWFVRIKERKQVYFIECFCRECVEVCGRECVEEDECFGKERRRGRVRGRERVREGEWMCGREREREGAWRECTSFPHCSMELPFTQNIWDSIVAWYVVYIPKDIDPPDSQRRPQT